MTSTQHPTTPAPRPDTPNAKWDSASGTLYFSGTFGPIPAGRPR